MKQLSNYILEKFKLSSKNIRPNYKPENKNELVEIISKLIKEDGNEVNLNNIDTSKIKDMSHLFQYENLPKFNGDISEWDVSNVKAMDFMFYGSSFNGNISQWDVSNVENMDAMFSGSKFNGDISGWDVSNVTNMDLMFYDSPLQEDPPEWYTIK